MVASLALMVLDHRQHHLETIRAALTIVISPLQYIADLPASTVNWLAEATSTRHTLQSENESLHAEHLQYQLRLQKMAALETENERLRQLLQSSSTIPDKVLIGELFAVDMDPFKRQVVVNRGSNDNVFAGQAMLDAHGVMGQLVHVGPFQSTAILVTDANHAVPVQVNRNGLRALALGTGEADKLEIPNLPTNADIQVGDLLVTSGLGGHFPPGYPVAKVISIHKNPGEPYAEVVAEPTARLERSREVLLVVQSGERKNLTALPGTTAPTATGEETPASVLQSTPAPATAPVPATAPARAGAKPAAPAPTPTAKPAATPVPPAKPAGPETPQ